VSDAGFGVCRAPRRRCREAADGEARHGESSTGGGGEAETLRARFGLRDGDGGEVDALHGESSTGKVGAGLAGDPEGGAAHAAGDVAEARAWGEAKDAGEVAEVLEGDEADVVEVVGGVGAGDELLPEAEEEGLRGMAS